MPKKQTEWSRAFNERAYARLAITIPKARKADVEAYIMQHGTSINALVNNLLAQVLGMSPEAWKTAAPDSDQLPEDENT